MTRETKIGLLVGLAFIIVVAILLTDHTTSTTEPRPAAQSDIGDNVRQSVTTPQLPIPTRADLARPVPGEPVKTPVRVVQPGAGRDDAVAPIDIRQDRAADAGRPTLAEGGMPGRGPDLVAQHPDELMAVTGVGRPGRAEASSAGPPPVIAPKTYVAQAGDSVSRIAARQMPGGDTPANRDLLIKANPSLQSEGHLVFLGKTYVIPSAGAVAQVADPARREAAGREAARREPALQNPPPSTPTTYWYTVREDDNLWRIAARELGDGGLWHQIKELNADLLGGGETVHMNQRIRLPRAGGSTASVN